MNDYFLAVFLGEKQMETPQDQEMARTYIPNLIDVKPDIAREYTISDLLHKIDPSASIDPLAEALFLDIADDFIDSVVTISTELAKARGASTMTAEDVENCIRHKFGDTTPGSMSYTPSHKTFLDSDIHQKRLNQVHQAEEAN